MPPNGLEPSCPADAGGSPLLYGTPAGQAPHPTAQRAGSAEGPAEGPRAVGGGELPGLQPVVGLRPDAGLTVCRV